MQPDDDKELRKSITSQLVAGTPVVLLDDVAHQIKSTVLAALLTAPTWNERLLGVSRSVDLIPRTVWMTSGNNLEFGGDLSRRIVPIRLDPEVPRPWERSDFTHDPLQTWVRAHRGELLAAVFTMARSWIQAGRPDPHPDTPAMGSFQAWRHVVGGILNFAGVTGFLQNLERVCNFADTAESDWGSLLEAVDTVKITRPFSSRELLKSIQMNDELQEALPDALMNQSKSTATETIPKSTYSIGRALRKNVGRQFSSPR